LPWALSLPGFFTQSLTGALRWGWNIERDEIDLEGGDQMRGMSYGGGLEYNIYRDM